MDEIFTEDIRVVIRILAFICSIVVISMLCPWIFLAIIGVIVIISFSLDIRDLIKLLRCKNGKN